MFRLTSAFSPSSLTLDSQDAQVPLESTGRRFSLGHLSRLTASVRATALERVALAHVVGASCVAMALAAAPTGGALAAPTMVPLTDALTTATEMLPDLMPPMTQTVSLFDIAMGGRPSGVRLSALYPQRSFTFGLGRDEVAASATLTLTATPSPFMTRESVVNVIVNDRVIGSLKLPASVKANAGATSQTTTLASSGATTANAQPVTATFTLDAKALRGYNRIDLEYQGVMGEACANPVDERLWADIAATSSLVLSVQKLRIENELTYLPQPFLVKNPLAQQTLPFAFDATPTTGMLEAAAMMASWAGREADWRGVSLPVYYNEAPVDAHFVTFVTPEHKPAFLANLPDPKGPGVAVMPAPFSLWAKVLVVMGRNDEELKAAARTFATGNAIFSGSRVTLTETPDVPPRAPYDAPRWVATDGPVALSTLTTYAGQLNTRGVQPAPVYLPFRLPPDLYTFSRERLPLELAVRATPTPKGGEGEVRVRLNGSMIAAKAIDKTVTGEKSNDGLSLLRFSAMNTAAGFWDSLGVPGVWLKPENALEVDFSYNVPVASGSPTDCRSARPMERQGTVDPRSTIDFSGFYHWAKLPDLDRFTRAGYPFTVHADLNGTTVVVPSAPDRASVAAMLTTLARLGAQTGAIATRVKVTTPEKAQGLKGDVMVFSRLTGNVSVEPSQALVTALKTAMTTSAAVVPDAQRLAGSAIVAMENPADAGRSVVGVLLGNAESAARLTQALATPAELNALTGGALLMTANGVTTFAPSSTYEVGSIPATARIWNALAERPWLLASTLLIAAALFAWLVYLLMRPRIRARLKTQAAPDKKGNH